MSVSWNISSVTFFVRMQSLQVIQVAGDGGVALRAESHMCIGHGAGLDAVAAFDVFAPHFFVTRNIRSTIRKPKDCIVRVVAEILVEIDGGVGRVKILFQLKNVGFGAGIGHGRQSQEQQCVEVSSRCFHELPHLIDAMEM